jgi:hypothetical protein
VSGYTIHLRMTPSSRLAFLQSVERDHATPWTGRATNDCLKLGWVEQLGDLDGRQITVDQIAVEYPAGEPRGDAYRRWTRIGFVLTDAGRSFLAAFLGEEGGA